jgi:hypothetical protein
MTTTTTTDNVSRVVARVLGRLAEDRVRFPGRSWPTDADAERLVRSVLRDTAHGVAVHPWREPSFATQVQWFRDRSAGANLARLLASELWGEV